MKDFKQEVQKILSKHVAGDIELSIPPDPKMGDYAFPCFIVAKLLNKNPVQVAQDLAKDIVLTKAISKVAAIGPYVNFFVNPALYMKEVLSEISKGSKAKARKDVIVIDYSSPNVAKHFGVHNLRSTTIGDALYRVYKAQGYKVVGVNHVGDWGTQYGKLFVAYNKWGDAKKLKKEGIEHLNSLYVKFHEKERPELEDEARLWFKKLEDGDEEAKKLWKLFRDISMEEFNRIYKRLGVKFDSDRGEAFYQPFIERTIGSLQDKGLTSISQGALVVNLDEHGLPPCLLKKSDGATLYGTRDIAAGMYRLHEYKPAKILYVVDHTQSLHFQQWFRVMEKLDKRNTEIFVHVDFGRMNFEEGGMSTRKGKIVKLQDVLDKAAKKVLKIINEKNPKLASKEKVAEQVAVGAVKFWDLVHDRVHDVTFDWDKVLDFQGETGPYVQYTHARACSMLRKSPIKKITSVEFKMLNHPSELKLVKILARYPVTLDTVVRDNKPSHLARYLIDLSQIFNEFYHNCPVLTQEKGLLKARLLIVDCTRIILAEGLENLGLSAPSRM